MDNTTQAILNSFSIEQLININLEADSILVKMEILINKMKQDKIDYNTEIKSIEDMFNKED